MRTLIAVLFLAGVVALQVFLSRSESKWPGLVIPGISFLISVWYALSYYAYAFVPSESEAVALALPVLVIFLIVNIPTYVFLAIYFACRGRYRRKKQIEKMNIQDLD